MSTTTKFCEISFREFLLCSVPNSVPTSELTSLVCRVSFQQYPQTDSHTHVIRQGLKRQHCQSKFTWNWAPEWMEISVTSSAHALASSTVQNNISTLCPPCKQCERSTVERMSMRRILHDRSAVPLQTPSRTEPSHNRHYGVQTSHKLTNRKMSTNKVRFGC
jgi:hypothetical protein